MSLVNLCLFIFIYLCWRQWRIDSPYIWRSMYAAEEEGGAGRGFFFDFDLSQMEVWMEVYMEVSCCAESLRCDLLNCGIVIVVLLIISEGYRLCGKN